MIYTIGHSNHAIEYFIDLLKSFEINMLVEVRSLPKSNFSPHFNKRNLMIELYKNNIKYIDMGKSLGGRPDDKSVLNYLGKIEFDKIEKRKWYEDSIESLIDLAKLNKIAIMCSEENPAECHRGYIITRSLINKGVEVIHIRGDKSYKKASFIVKQEVLPL